MKRDPDIVLHAGVGFNGAPGNYLFRSNDGGQSWTEVPSWRGGPAEVIIELYIDPTALPDNLRVFAATNAHIYRSDDGGESWRTADAGVSELPEGSRGGKRIIDFNAVMKDGRPRLFLTARTSLDGDKLRGGVYRSDDLGETWVQKVSGLSVREGGSVEHGRVVDYEELGVCPSSPDVLYLGSHENGGPTVYRSVDGAETWRVVLTAPGEWNFPKGVDIARDWEALDYGWTWGEDPHEIGVCPTNPDILGFGVDGRTWRSDDGGKSWRACNAIERAPGDNWWRTSGLSGSTTYRFKFDPRDHKRVYITYTDNGFQQSRDGGEYWRLSIKGSPWGNTFYDVAIDPDEPSRMWAVASNHHDLPYEKMLRQDVRRFSGGVLATTDYAENWRDLGHDSGLPVGAPTAVIIDPKSPVDSRTLYVAVIGSGVYKSTDAGASWKPANNGLGTPANHNAYLLKMTPSGAIYCAVTLAIDSDGRHPGGLYKTTDGAASWQRVTAGLELPYICGFDMDPRDEDVLYVGSRHSQGFLGGCWKTTNGGASWRRVFDLEHVFGVDIDPQAPDRVYLCLSQGDDFRANGGIYMSEDAGETFTKLPGYPFERFGPHYVSFNPDDSRTIYVTNFGGSNFKGFVPRPK